MTEHSHMPSISQWTLDLAFPERFAAGGARGSRVRGGSESSTTPGGSATAAMPGSTAEDCDGGMLVAIVKWVLYGF